jgi:small subunit ribosomal protein S17
MKNNKVFSGVVVSKKMTRTLLVRVDEQRVNPLYKVPVKRSTRYKVDCYNPEDYSIGEEVEFVQCRPVSKEKRHRIVSNKSKEQG